MLSARQQFYKLFFDLILGVFLLLILIVPLVIFILIAGMDTHQSGWFSQKRIGKDGKPFTIYKIRTLRSEPEVFASEAENSSAFGRFLRSYHIDEWPQLINILKGDMSFVGPRPDLLGYADMLVGEDCIILSVRPGLTGPASLKYRNEEQLLNKQSDPETYYRQIIWPDKVKINKAYIQTYSFYLDLRILLKTVFNV